ncbi:DEAD/DEAH box helicase [Compostimonas suwonensis]|uniref:SNF2 family DNA or RNA helicase n=1 Tax=Compostimonas suwonensis TaxID=1048394 RepID=A0A2M9C3Q8_9MICO|nr:DEAD/DEAH box helicase [Compostimonas suwonensis]PJJ65164.1 SNF2 family DNA or RNA helicase [Compostimonas suwonensis]
MSPAAFPLVDAVDILRLVGHPSFERGRDDARAGRVTRIDWHAETSRLSGAVSGDGEQECWVELRTNAKGYVPVDSYCSCPLTVDCRHVTALMFRSNTEHVRDDAATRQDAGAWATASATTAGGDPGIGPDPSTGADTGTGTGTARRTTRPQKTPAQPGWKTVMTALTARPPASASRHAPGRTAERAPGQTSPMGLQFEVREHTERERDRWLGPVVKAATAQARRGPRHLGVRPVMRNDKGNWVRGNLGWNSFAHQSHQLNLNPEHRLWFAQFAAVQRADRALYPNHDPEWLYLDDFASPLLWRLLDDASELGIPLLGSKKDTVVTIGRQAVVGLDAARAPDGEVRLTPVLAVDGQRHGASEAGAIGTHGVYLYELAPTIAFTLAPTSRPIPDEQRALLSPAQPLVVPAADLGAFLDDYYPRLRQVIEVTSTDGSVELPQIAPPVLVLTATFQAKQALRLDWAWQYGDETSRGGRMPLHPLPGSPGFRDEAAERDILNRVESTLRGAGPDAPPLESRTTLRGLEAAMFSEKVLPLLEQLVGVRLDVVGERPDYHELTEPPQLIVTTVETDKRDWFDLGVMVTIEGRTIPFQPLFTAMSKGKDRLLLIDNSYLSLHQPALEQLRELIEEARSLQEWETGLRISRYQASLWAEFEDLADETVQAQTWRESAAALGGVTGVDEVPVPSGVHATLRPYQAEGFSWLVFLWKHRLGGILADDMGLGKTLQALALVAHTRETAATADAAPAANADAPPTGPDPGGSPPFLVVAPTSVVSNWLSEAQRFTPGLVVRAVTTTQAKGRMPLAELARGADILVTSYTLFRLDNAAYREQPWAGMILDEAQFVKNHGSAVHRHAREMELPFTLAITGTPMENNLMELWALFSIVAPGLFASAPRFREGYLRSIERGETEPLARLRRRIRPLMMRRTKELVATELPPKQEQVLTIELAPRHRKLYDTVLQRERQKLLGLIDDDLDRNRFIVFRSLTLLRMLSLDASLIDEEYASIPSSKLDALVEQLDDVVAEGHRALVFSQFTSFLRKAATRLEEQGIDVVYLDGSTRNRREVIGGFTEGTAPVFLISLKAGGFGLNLTEADYVFLLDPWWNPAAEDQAIDRTHRIGQTKNVMVYRMVAADTIEEKVMALQRRKAKLFASVIDDEALFSSALTADDIRGLLDA